MHEEETRVFWELVFLRFHSLRDKDAAGLFGEILAARYGPPERHLPSGIDKLLDRLEQAELAGSRRAQPRPEPCIPGHQQSKVPSVEHSGGEQVVRPLMVACEIIDIIEKTADARAPLDVEAAADVIIGRHAESGLTRREVVEVLREEASAAGVLPPKPTNE